MTHLFSLNITDYDSWREHDNRLSHFFHKSVVIFIVLFLLLVAVLSFYGMIAKEDIYVTLDDFSVTIGQEDNKRESVIYLTGITPYEIVNTHPLVDAKFAKLYFAKKIENVFSKTYVKILNAHIRLIQSGQKEDQMKKKSVLVRQIDTGIIYATLSPVDENNRNMISMLANLKTDENYIRKAKIIFGETSLFKYWIRKIFGNSDLANVASSFMQ